MKPRRLREHPKLRDLMRETVLSANDFVLPLFVKAGMDKKSPIQSMPGHFQLTLNDLETEIEKIASLGIPAVLLFGIPEEKDAIGSAACDDRGIVQKAIKEIKKIAPELLVITDLCFCEYTDHGHCGPLKKRDAASLKSVLSPFEKRAWVVDNDQTLALLAKQAQSHAKAGADVIAPSGMMDGMVAAIRQGLDEAGYSHLPILSYSTKYCSALYAPFREAAESTPGFGDRRGYQMDIANAAEALRETALDVAEGADMLMVKPAGAYLDIIYRVKQAYPEIPLAAYQVSGEFSMIKAAAMNGWLDERKVALESLIAIKRAGADIILTYFAKDAVRWLNES
jgi:porphobilinogen synthase